MVSKEIDSDEAEKLGVWTMHHRMSNGEFRFRLRNKDGNDYIRTVASENSGWQESHHHENLRETYIVQSGRMALAEWINDTLHMRIFYANEIVTTRPTVPHNVYLFPNAIIQTVKYSQSGEAGDRYPDPFLDDMTIHLNEDKILKLASTQHVQVDME